MIVIGLIGLFILLIAIYGFGTLVFLASGFSSIVIMSLISKGRMSNKSIVAFSFIIAAFITFLVFKLM